MTAPKFGGVPVPGSAMPSPEANSATAPISNAAALSPSASLVNNSLPLFGTPCRQMNTSADIGLHRQIDPIGAFGRVGADRALWVLRLDVAPAPLPDGDAVDDRDPGARRRSLPAFGLAFGRLKNVIAGRAGAARLGERHRQIAQLRL